MCEPACTWQPVHPRSECECARAETCDRGVTEECAPVCACMRQDPWFEGRGDGLAGDPAFPQQGASGQSLRLWSGFNASPFRGSSASSCSWRQPGQTAPVMKATWPRSVPRRKPALSWGALLENGFPGSLPRGGEPQQGRAEGVKSRSAATGPAAPDPDPEPRGRGSAMIPVRRLQHFTLG